MGIAGYCQHTPPHTRVFGSRGGPYFCEECGKEIPVKSVDTSGPSSDKMSDVEEFRQRWRDYKRAYRALDDCVRRMGLDLKSE